MRKWGLVLCCVVVMLGVVSLNPLLAQAPKELKIGFIAPLSGPAAPWGITWLRGVEMAIKDINGAGGMNVKGQAYLLKVISEDDKYNPALTTNAAHRLIDEHGVKFIHGSITSPGAIATSTVSEPAKVIIMVGGAAKNRLGPEKPFTFCIHVGHSEQAFTAYPWVAKAFPKIKTVASIQPNDETGQAYVEMVTPLYSGLGWTSASVEYYERGTKDFYPLLGKVLPKNPDFVNLSGNPAGTIGLIVKQARELGYKGVMMATGAIDADTLMKVAPAQALEGFISDSMTIPGPHLFPAEEKFYQRYMKEYGPPWQALAIDSYDGTMMLKKAIEQVGSVTDTPAIRDVFANMTYEGIRGKVFYGGEKTYGIKRQLATDFVLSIFRNGKPENTVRINGMVP